jgi:hypothetical protein
MSLQKNILIDKCETVAINAGSHYEIVSLKNDLAKVPQMEQRLHRLLGMEEILLIQQQEEQKPDLKVANQK